MSYSKNAPNHFPRYFNFGRIPLIIKSRSSFKSIIEKPSKKIFKISSSPAMSFQNITDFLTAFLSADNQVRRQAESFLDQIQNQSPVQALEYLLSGLDLPESNVIFFIQIYFLSIMSIFLALLPYIIMICDFSITSSPIPSLFFFFHF